MKKIYLDIESYYDDQYTLQKMTTLEYALDARFEMIGCGVITNDGPPCFMPQEKVIEFLKNLNEPYAMICHNALFDATVLAWRYGIHPTVIVDTIAMSRALLAHKTKQSRVSLAAVLECLGLEGKLDTIKDMKGVHYADLTRNPDLLMMLNTYTIRDVRACKQIFNILIPDFPEAELRVVDRVVRMCTMPQLILDTMNLRQYYNDIISHKRALLAQFDHQRTSYLSNQQFADILRSHGVEPPMKISARTGKETYAFAKTDEKFMELFDHPNLTVQALMAARLGVKTTIEETRTATFLRIAHLTASSYGDSWLPVPLKYSGAHTHRFSGDWRLNMQNLSARKSRTLRSSIRAPYGSTVLAVDASQIEARLTAYLAKQENLLEQFRLGADVYSWFGSQIYGYAINKRDNPIERFNSKTIVLGLGFGMSAKKLLFTLKNAASENHYNIEYTLEQCQQWVDSYRMIFPNIVHLWARCGWMLDQMRNKEIFKTLPTDDKIQAAAKLYMGEQAEIPPCRTDGTDIILPSKLRLYYDDLQYEGNSISGGEITYRYGSGRRKIYGAKITENIVQALDRQHVIEANMRIENRCYALGMDIRLALQIHDENCYVVSNDKLDIVAQIALEEMCRPPKWALNIPLAAEIKVGQSFGELNEWSK